MLFIPDIGKLRLLDYHVQNLFFSGNLVARLYKNNHTPSAADVLADYDQADFQGYADINLNAWTTPIMSAELAITEGPPYLWECTAVPPDNDIYGIAWYDGSNSDILWVEVLVGGPVLIRAAGDRVLRHPIFSLTAQE